MNSVESTSRDRRRYTARVRSGHSTGQAATQTKQACKLKVVNKANLEKAIPMGSARDLFLW